MSDEQERSNPEGDGKETGNEYKVGYKKPPINTRFGQPGATKKRGKRAKTFDELRAKTLGFLNEIATDKDGKQIIRNGVPQTNLDMLLNTMMRSDNPSQVQKLIEYGFGKVPDELRIDLSRLDDDELLKTVGPILARFGISLDAPGSEGVQAAPGDGNQTSV